VIFLPLQSQGEFFAVCREPIFEGASRSINFHAIQYFKGKAANRSLAAVDFGFLMARFWTRCCAKFAAALQMCILRVDFRRIIGLPARRATK
jgi:hypothetical protein